MSLLTDGPPTYYQTCRECGQETWGGKPYCADHVLLNPYARQVADRAPPPEPRKPRPRNVRDQNDRQCVMCGRVGVRSRGLCVGCYERERRNGRLEVNRVERAEACPCGRQHHSGGYCNRCYARWRAGRKPCTSCGVPMTRPEEREADECAACRKSQRRTA